MISGKMDTQVRSLSERLQEQPRAQRLEKLGGLIAYPHDWQHPAATEQAAYEGVARRHHSFDSGPIGFEYLGFPWATLIDGLSRRSEKALKILNAVSASGSIERRAQGA